MSEPDVTQIVAGSGLLYVAPLGTTLPTIDVHGEYPVTWPAGWVAVGYTDSGIDLAYAPTLHPIMVDEEPSVVGDILETEKATVSAVLAEANLTNYQNAISASTYTNDLAGSAQIVKIGNKALTYVMVGFEGPASGTNKRRVVLIQKAIATATVNMKLTRKDNVKFNVAWEARKISGQDLVDIYDLTSTAS